MINNINTNNGNNTVTNSKETSSQNTIPEPTIQSPNHVSHSTIGKTITSEDGIILVCFACYIEKSVQGSLDVLETVREMISMKAEKVEIEEGLDLVEFALEGLLEQLAAKPHGEGLSKQLIPVRGIPYVVNQQPQSEQTPVKEA